MDAMKKVRMWELVLNQAKRATGPSRCPIEDIEEFIYENKSGTAAIGLSLIGLATFSYYQIWKTTAKPGVKSCMYGLPDLKVAHMQKLQKNLMKS